MRLSLADLNSRLVVAGGAGGGGSNYICDPGGAGGGLVGGTGVGDSDSVPGTGGSQTTGGLAGSYGGNTPHPGTFGFGGGTAAMILF